MPETTEDTMAGEGKVRTREEALSRYRGCLLGLAAGDALGTTLEFREPGSFEPLADMVGGGSFHLAPGQWTDDTSMALCLADSILATGACDPRDQAERYLRWYREGHRSSRDECFDIGVTTAGALARFERDGDPFSGPVDPRSAGNGSLMRLAPVPMAFATSYPEDLLEALASSSRVTHGAAEAVDACLYFGGLILGALLGETKERLLSPLYFPIEGLWTVQGREHGWRLSPAVEAVALGSFREKEPPRIRGTGYVIASMEAALWAFHRSSSFEEGALLAVNLGNDADTTGAVYGQLAGACYGEEGIPPRWRELIHRGAEIGALAERLFERTVLPDLCRNGEGWRTEEYSTWDVMVRGCDTFSDARRERWQGIARVLRGRFPSPDGPPSPPRPVPILRWKRGDGRGG